VPKVFFDGGCPLCRREIAHYRRMDRAGRLRWIDIAGEAGTLSGYGLTPDRAMAELHVLDSAGRWQRGIDGFLVIWMHLPTYRWLARLVQVLRMRAPLGLMYQQFARLRYRIRCGADGCSVARHTRGS
jgi:predicted DCC family thiol-disulfide oxidoreductase YuxK